MWTDTQGKLSLTHWGRRISIIEMASALSIVAGAKKIIVPDMFS